MKLVRSIASIVLLGILLTGCSVNPVTGQQELSLMSPEQEVAIGAQQYGPSQQSQGGRYVVDPDLNVYVNAVGQKLAAVSDRPDLPYEFVVLNNSVPNAWALPGGKIAINRGLLVLLEDEAQLAAVLGHEIVHAAARHSAQQQTRGTLLNVGLMAAGVALATQEHEAAGLAMGALGVGAQAWQAQYGQGQELQSDKYGIEYMVAAGYDPQGAVELQQTFVKLSEGQQSSWLDSFFASHPPSQKRVDRNRQMAAAYNGGVRNRAEYQDAIAQLKKDSEAYGNYQKALKAASEDDLGTARQLIDKAIQQQPKETLFWEAKGRLYAQDKAFAESADAFGKAITANPEFFRPYVYRGLAYSQLKKSDAAANDLEKSMALLPTQIAAYYLGEYALENGQQQKAVEYFQMAAQGGGELGQKAQARLQQMQQGG
ncbi:M48 family metalloprotease [Gilvimarinus sp. SDUM040013]|uniref:M48 family metalloprotease n=1 Tax=Gilvimarinus gilvus TaxID=3058038 RepID=A0ABU4RZL1_9GAMM|nr:M48 family metalloprotease [Gilvimarinus sp. SDUM040013]MDO3388701.1 M48 family metalloprotease [Gilvimarinus sp. SDUM040013]MDX6849596.1 M48 family metalloprotease [Gilvimarinus sp. SDUM040013]